MTEKEASLRETALSLRIDLAARRIGKVLIEEVEEMVQDDLPLVDVMKFVIATVVYLTCLLNMPNDKNKFITTTVIRTLQSTLKGE